MIICKWLSHPNNTQCFKRWKIICVCVYLIYSSQYLKTENQHFFFTLLLKVSSFRAVNLLYFLKKKKNDQFLSLFQIALFSEFGGALCNLEYVIILCVCTYPNNHWTTSIYQTVPSSSAGLNQKFPNFEPRFISTLKPNFLLS